MFAPLQRKIEQSAFPKEIVQTFSDFLPTYVQALEKQGRKGEEAVPLLLQYLDLVAEQIQQPYVFPPFHASIREPFDYYSFGLSFFHPLVDWTTSAVEGEEELKKIAHYLERNENGILFANHQTEPDPQLLSLLLQKNHPHLAEKIIFIAGHRVTTDPLAVPFSLGCNILSIFSKKYLNDPPEQKPTKIAYNQKTMQTMADMLQKGGFLIYVAPSGGRDRPDEKGVVDVSPFDPQSVEMFYLMAKQSSQPTHFFPLALWTYDTLPPPNGITHELGERREAGCSTVKARFGPEIDMEFGGFLEGMDKKEKRGFRAEKIWEMVQNDYQQIRK